MRRGRKAAAGQSRSMSAGSHQRRKHTHAERMELAATVLLGLAALATAWSSYQASRWHGEQAEAQSLATAKRVESTRASGVANREAEIDVELFIQWVDARQQGDTELAAFYRSRFTDRFKPAFRAWIATVRSRSRRAAVAVRDAGVPARGER